VWPPSAAMDPCIAVDLCITVDHCVAEDPCVAGSGCECGFMCFTGSSAAVSTVLTASDPSVVVRPLLRLAHNCFGSGPWSEPSQYQYAAGPMLERVPCCSEPIPTVSREHSATVSH
jgi:hypothetical protein